MDVLSEDDEITISIGTWDRIVKTIPDDVAYREIDCIYNRAAHYTLLNESKPCWFPTVVWMILESTPNETIN